MTAIDLAGLPWTEVAAALGTLILLLVTIANRRLSKIKEEFSANGGASLRDAINRIESTTAANRGRIWAIAADNPKALWESDKDGLCVWMNRTGLKWLRVGVGELSGRGWIGIIAPKDRARVVAEWDQCIKDGRPFDLDYCWQDTSGTDIPVSAHTHAIEDHTGKIVGWVGIATRLPAQEEPKEVGS